MLRADGQAPEQRDMIITAQMKDDGEYLVPVPMTSKAKVTVRLNGKRVQALLDTGADFTFATSALLAKIPGYNEANVRSAGSREVVTANETTIDVIGIYPLPVKVAGIYLTLPARIVTQMVFPLVLGRDFCDMVGAQINFPEKTVYIRAPTPLVSEENLQILPGHCAQVRLKISEEQGEWEGEQGMVSQLPEETSHPAVRVEPSLSAVNEGVVMALVSNYGPEPVQVGSGDPVACLEEVELSGTEETEELLTLCSVMCNSQNMAASQLVEGSPEVSPHGRRPQASVPTVATEYSLEDIIDLSQADLDEGQKIELRKLIRKYEDVFVGEDGQLGWTDVVKHTIRTHPDQPPIRQRPYRVGYHARKIIEDQVQDMLKKGVIIPSDSPWASPVVLVTKKDGTPRFCIDFRKLNAVTIMDSFPLPDIRQCLDVFGTVRAKYFSSLDCRNAFWQVAMDPETAEKSAFITSEGLYQFEVLPFGLSGAPGCFQRIMGVVLRGLLWKNCLAYMDDVMVMSSTFSQHLTDLAAVFDRLRQAGLKLGPSKCNFARTQVHFLGHVISDRGIEVDPAKVQAVRDLIEPRTPKEVRSFLGLAGYYRRFCANYAKIVHPLHQLTRKGVDFCWTPECQAAFEQVKILLTQAPVLAYPRFEQPYVLFTDASGVAVGHVLAQIQDGTERVIAYGGRALRKHEKNYPVTELEFLAIIHAVATCDSYIRYVPCTVYTDHTALKGLLARSEPKGRMARWILCLQMYQLTIQYKPGRVHGNADALSRQEYSQKGVDLDPPHPLFAAVATRAGGRLPPVTATPRYQQSLSGEVEFYIQYGKVTQLPVGVIICPVQGTGADETGITAEILQRAGAVAHEQYRNNLVQYEKMMVGRTMVIAAGLLPASYLVCVAYPRYADDRTDNKERLYGAIYNALREAALQEKDSVALPAMCIGRFGYDSQEASRTFRLAILDFVKSQDRKKIKSIFVVDDRHQGLKSLIREWKKPTDNGTNDQQKTPLPVRNKVSSQDRDLAQQPENPQGERPPIRSRRPVPHFQEQDSDETKDHWLPKLDEKDEYQELQKNDPDLSGMYEYLTKGILPLRPKEARQIAATAEDFCMKDGILHHIWIKPGRGKPADRACLQVAVPACYKYGVIYHHHTHEMAGHRGIDGTCVSIRAKYFWPHMVRDITDFVSSCEQCAKARPAGERRNTPLQLTAVEGPFERVHVDILGPFATSENGEKYVLTMVDSFTRWTEIRALVDQTAFAVAETMYNEWVCRYGVPRTVVSDRGSNFVSMVVSQLHDRLGVGRIMTSSYHPAGNAMVERRHADIVKNLKKLVENQPAKWPKYLAPVAFAKNTAVCKSTDYTPFFLMFGREADRPVDRRMPVNEPVAHTVQNRIQELVRRVEYFDALAKENDEKSRERYKKYYDDHIKDDLLTVGDRVYLYTPQLAAKMKTGRKLLSPWTGPYTIIRYVSPVTIKLRACADLKELESPVHVNRVCRYYVPGLLPPAPPDKTMRNVDKNVTETRTMEPSTTQAKDPTVNPGENVQNDQAKDPTVNPGENMRSEQAEISTETPGEKAESKQTELPVVSSGENKENEQLQQISEFVSPKSAEMDGNFAVCDNKIAQSRGCFVKHFILPVELDNTGRPSAGKQARKCEVVMSREHSEGDPEGDAGSLQRDTDTWPQCNTIASPREHPVEESDGNDTALQRSYILWEQYGMIVLPRAHQAEDLEESAWEPQVSHDTLGQCSQIALSREQQVEDPGEKTCDQQHQRGDDTLGPTGKNGILREPMTEDLDVDTGIKQSNKIKQDVIPDCALDIVKLEGNMDGKIEQEVDNEVTARDPPEQREPDMTGPSDTSLTTAKCPMENIIDRRSGEGRKIIMEVYLKDEAGKLDGTQRVQLVVYGSSSHNYQENREVREPYGVGGCERPPPKPPDFTKRGGPEVVVENSEKTKL